MQGAQRACRRQALSILYLFYVLLISCIAHVCILYVCMYVYGYVCMKWNGMYCTVMQSNAMQCNAMQYNATHCNAMQCNAMYCNVMQCNVM